MIELRKALPQDAEILARTRQIVWKETYRGIYPDHMLDDYDLEFYTCRDRQRIQDLDHHYYLFMQDDQCVGYFSYGPYNFGTYKDFSLCLNNLYIRKDFQRMGLGRRAFTCIRTYCAEKSINKFFCGCNAHNLSAIGFYLHMGGIQADIPELHENKADDILHFEFYTGE